MIPRDVAPERLADEAELTGVDQPTMFPGGNSSGTR
ncbi:hypothetical protein ACVJGD_004160 [Bradyrhizobium sp. USDA 10063]